MTELINTFCYKISIFFPLLLIYIEQTIVREINSLSFFYFFNFLTYLHR